jgi:hypothetical protein
MTAKSERAGFNMRQLNVVGKGYRAEETVVGFFNTGDRIKVWGRRCVLRRSLGAFLSSSF